MVPQKVEELNDRYKYDDANMYQENLQKKKEEKNKKSQISLKIKGIDSRLVDDLELEETEYPNEISSKIELETIPILGTEIVDDHSILFNKWKNRKEKEDEENAFLNLSKKNFGDIFDIEEYDAPPKKIANLNLKEKFAHINAIIEEEKLNKTNPQELIIFDSIN